MNLLPCIIFPLQPPAASVSPPSLRPGLRQMVGIALHLAPSRQRGSELWPFVSRPPQRLPRPPPQCERSWTSSARAPCRRPRPSARPLVPSLPVAACPSPAPAGHCQCWPGLRLSPRSRQVTSSWRPRARPPRQSDRPASELPRLSPRPGAPVCSDCRSSGHLTTASGAQAGWRGQPGGPGQRHKGAAEHTIPVTAV